MPPEITGESVIDAQALNYWCGGLITHLRKILSNIEDNNIVYLSADKLISGNINTDKISLTGTNINITENSVTFSSDGAEILSIKTDPNGYSLKISNKDGTKYIHLHDDILDISADNITADTVTANSIIINDVVTANVINCQYIYAGNLDDSGDSGGGGIIA